MTRLSARLTKLEEAAKRVVRCAWCRYHLIPSVEPSLTKDTRKASETARASSVEVSCPFCGSKYLQNVGGMTPEEKESFLLWYRKYDGETYRDVRAFAAKRWWTYRWIVQGSLYPAPYRPPAPQRKPTRHERERALLKEQADKLEKDAKELEKRLYEPRAFPLVATLEGITEGLKELDRKPYTPGFIYYPPAESKARQLLIYARLMEACELALWGEARPDTLAEIEARSAEVSAFEETREREKREREEKERREREEKERREREERERQRLEREAAPRPATPARDVSGYYQTARHSQGLQPIEFPPPDNKPAFFDPFSDDDAFLSRGQPPDPLALYVARWGNRPPPDDGTLAYQRRLAHWKETGEWLPDARLPSYW